jgi:hypothetical protein
VLIQEMDFSGESPKKHGVFQQPGSFWIIQFCFFNWFDHIHLSVKKSLISQTHLSNFVSSLVTFLYSWYNPLHAAPRPPLRHRDRLLPPSQLARELCRPLWASFFRGSARWLAICVACHPKEEKAGTAKAGRDLPPAFDFLVGNLDYFRAVWNSSFNATTIIAPATKATTKGKT